MLRRAVGPSGARAWSFGVSSLGNMGQKGGNNRVQASRSAVLARKVGGRAVIGPAGSRPAKRARAFCQCVPWASKDRAGSSTPPSTRTPHHTTTRHAPHTHQPHQRFPDIPSKSPPMPPRPPPWSPCFFPLTQPFRIRDRRGAGAVPSLRNNQTLREGDLAQLGDTFLALMQFPHQDLASSFVGICRLNGWPQVRLTSDDLLPHHRMEMGMGPSKARPREAVCGGLTGIRPRPRLSSGIPCPLPQSNPVPSSQSQPEPPPEPVRGLRGGECERPEGPTAWLGESTAAEHLRARQGRPDE